MHARKPIRTLQLKFLAYSHRDLHLTRSLIITLVSGSASWKQGSYLPGWSPVDAVVVVVVFFVVIVVVVVNAVVVVVDVVGTVFPV